jgi:hypothetical protein
MAALTRHDLAAGTLLIGSATADPAVAAPSRLQHLEAEILAVGRLTAELNARDHDTEEEWSAWSKREGALLREIHALPATVENARLKARGILQIYNGDLNDWGAATWPPISRARSSALWRVPHDGLDFSQKRAWPDGRAVSHRRSRRRRSGDRVRRHHQRRRPIP